MHLLWVKRVHFYLQGWRRPRRHAGGCGQPTLQVVFYSAGCSSSAGASGAGVSAGAASRMACFSAMVWFSSSTRAWAASRAASRSAFFAVGVQRGLGLFQCALGLGQIRVCLIHGRLRVNALLCAAQLGFGGRCGVIGDTALQQGGLFRQGLCAAIGGSQAQALAIIAAPDGDKALAGGPRSAACRRQPSG